MKNYCSHPGCIKYATFNYIESFINNEPAKWCSVHRKSCMTSMYNPYHKRYNKYEKKSEKIVKKIRKKTKPNLPAGYYTSSVPLHADECNDMSTYFSCSSYTSRDLKLQDRVEPDHSTSEDLKLQDRVEPDHSTNEDLKLQDRVEPDHSTREDLKLQDHDKNKENVKPKPLNVDQYSFEDQYKIMINRSIIIDDDYDNLKDLYEKLENTNNGYACFGYYENLDPIVPFGFDSNGKTKNSN